MATNPLSPTRPPVAIALLAVQLIGLAMLSGIAPLIHATGIDWRPIILICGLVSVVQSLRWLFNARGVRAAQPPYVNQMVVCSACLFLAMVALFIVVWNAPVTVTRTTNGVVAEYQVQK